MAHIVRCVINGHLAWTCQHASGNRGDDFRSLKIAELQPYTFIHPNGRTPVQCVLACQGEEKAGAGRGMHTVRHLTLLCLFLSVNLQKTNPVYTVLMPHLEAHMCPISALAFSCHWMHDVKNLTEELNIDWALNKSWRQVGNLNIQI